MTTSATSGSSLRALEQDPFRNTADDDLLTGLRGKDVLLVFVESYGRTALDLPVVESALDAGERRLQKAGFSSRSGFLTSPTFGGLSWLAHITLQSGLWVDSQRRYDHLSTLHRLTLTDAFGRAGWRTVAAVPANEKEWPMATTYYHYDQVWDARNVGYVGPRFGYARDAGPVHVWRRSSAWNSNSRTGHRLWRRSIWSRATAPGRRCPGSSTGATLATARSSTRCRPRASRRRTCCSDPDRVQGRLCRVHRLHTRRGDVGP